MRIVLTGALLLTGLAVGSASAAVHSTWWGLPLAVGATATTAYALPGGWTRRAAFVLGWATAVVALALPRPEGDIVIAGDLHGYVLIGFGLVLLVAGFVTLPPPRPKNPVDTPSPPPTS